LRDVERISGIHYTQLSRYENGLIVPASHAAILAEVLGIQPETLYT
jgi:hypothetical protein